jgi:indole-3-acetate monooxygenase
MTIGTDQDLPAAARAVAELASDEMHRAEAEGKLTDPVVDAIRDGGLLRIWIPRSLGGEEMDVVPSLDVIETLSYGDPSAGWVVFAGGLIGATTAAYCGPECVDALFAPGEPLPWISGHGTRPGTAVPAGDGWTLSGSWSFGSGLLHATHTHNLAIIEGTGEARIFVTPVSDAHLLRDSWDVLGLRATGSIDYTIDGAFVPRDWSHAAGQTSSERGGLLYNLGIIGFVTLGHAAWALGVGRRMLDELIGLVEAKAGRAGAQAEDPAFLEGFQVAEGRLRSARALVHETWGDVAASFAAGDEMTVRQQTLARLALVNATFSVHEVAQFAYLAGGTAPLKTGTVIQKLFRDVHAGTQHISSGPIMRRNTGLGLLGHVAADKVWAFAEMVPSSAV